MVSQYGGEGIARTTRVEERESRATFASFESVIPAQSGSGGEAVLDGDFAV